MSVIKNMIETYEQIYQVEKDYPLEIIVTEKIYEERLKLCYTKSEQAGVEAAEQELKNSHKLLVLPDDQDSHFYLLLHENIFNETTNYCQPIAHEYTRLIDYAECQEKYAIKNLREDAVPDADCFNFLSQVRACFRGYSLWYNLTSMENKAVLFSYLCGIVPEYEEELSHDLPAHMQALAEFYGQCLAISTYVNFDVSLPDYLNRHPVHDLLTLVHDNIENTGIFENYELISEAYNNFVLRKTEILHVHSHKCSHSHEESDNNE